MNNNNNINNKEELVFPMLIFIVALGPEPCAPFILYLSAWGQPFSSNMDSWIWKQVQVDVQVSILCKSGNGGGHESPWTRMCLVRAWALAPLARRRRPAGSPARVFPNTRRRLVPFRPSSGALLSIATHGKRMHKQIVLVISMECLDIHLRADERI